MLCAMIRSRHLQEGMCLSLKAKAKMAVDPRLREAESNSRDHGAFRAHAGLDPPPGFEKSQVIAPRCL